MTTGPADRLERRWLGDLIPGARHARTPSATQVAQIAASIRDWGWTNPVLIDAYGRLIPGHDRVMAAHPLGFETAPLMVARGWPEARKHTDALRRLFAALG